jgi:hypothetical protein
MKRALIIIAVLVVLSVLLTGCTIPKKLAALFTPNTPAVQTEQAK